MKVLLVEGGPRQAIVAMAADWHADTIGIGSHGRHELDRALLGSVSDGVVRHAPCSMWCGRRLSEAGPRRHRDYLQP